MASLPALAHVLLFVGDLARVADFYQQLLGLRPAPSTDEGFVVLAHPSGGAGLALHRAPPGAVAPLASPPAWREDTALKPCFQVGALDEARTRLLALGGQAKEPWAWNGQRFCECADPEGNVLQLFERPTP